MTLLSQLANTAALETSTPNLPAGLFASVRDRGLFYLLDQEFLGRPKIIVEKHA